MEIESKAESNRWRKANAPPIRQVFRGSKRGDPSGQAIATAVVNASAVGGCHDFDLVFAGRRALGEEEVAQFPSLR